MKCIYYFHKIQYQNKYIIYSEHKIVCELKSYFHNTERHKNENERKYRNLENFGGEQFVFEFP